jgi:hypothetical protein
VDQPTRIVETPARVGWTLWRLHDCTITVIANAVENLKTKPGTMPRVPFLEQWSAKSIAGDMFRAVRV